MPGKRTAAWIVGLAVALGAMGAHALAGVLAVHGREGVWQTAVFYQVVHGFGIWLNALSPGRDRVAAYCFLAGVVVFSGSLYLLALTEWRWLGAVTPIGGVAFLAGWLRLAFRGNG